jgi:outer membrane protein assembly factor BamA
MKGMKILCLLLITVCTSLTLAIPVLAQKKLVEDLEIRGYRSVSREQILEKIKTRPGGVYKEGQVKADFQRILGMGVFDKPHCTFVIEEGPRGGVVVIFVLKEVPKGI